MAARRRARNRIGGCARLAGAALLLAGGLAAGAGAQPADDPGSGRPPFGRHGPPPFERVLERNADRLGLDDDTRARIREIARASRDATRDERERLRTLRTEMRELLDQDVPDEAAVMAKADEIGAAETDLQKERLRTMLAIRALLTPEQREELVRIHEEMKRERGWRAGPGGRPGFGRGRPRPPR